MLSLYETYQEALHTIQELEAAKVPSGEISMIAMNGRPMEMDAIEELKQKIAEEERRHTAKALQDDHPRPINPAPHLQGKFFSRLNLFPVKDLGALIAGGWLIEPYDPGAEHAAQVTDLPELLSRMMGAGADDQTAETLVEGIRRGGTLVGVWPDCADHVTVKRIMQEDHSPLDPHMRGHHYWTRATKVTDKESSATKRLLAMLIPSLK